MTSETVAAGADSTGHRLTAAMPGSQVTLYSVTRLVTRFSRRWYSLLLVTAKYSLLRYRLSNRYYSCTSILGECCELPQWGLGQNTSRYQIRCVL